MSAREWNPYPPPSPELPYEQAKGQLGQYVDEHIHQLHEPVRPIAHGSLHVDSDVRVGLREHLRPVLGWLATEGYTEPIPTDEGDVDLDSLYPVQRLALQALAAMPGVALYLGELQRSMSATDDAHQYVRDALGTFIGNIEHMQKGAVEWIRPKYLRGPLEVVARNFHIIGARGTSNQRYWWGGLRDAKETKLLTSVRDDATLRGETPHLEPTLLASGTSRVSLEPEDAQEAAEIRLERARSARRQRRMLETQREEWRQRRR